MTDEEAKKLFQAIHLRGDKDWATSSGGFLDLLKSVAREASLATIPEANRIYFGRFPEAADFIAGRLPAILLNNYPPFRDAASHRRAIEWLDANPDWAEQVKANAATDRLPTIVDAIVANLTAYTNETDGSAPSG